MLTIRFQSPDGAWLDCEAEVGSSIMLAAVAHDIPGIIGECGGCCACGTCHVYLKPDALASFPRPSPEEAMMLEGVMHPSAGSRLGCQLHLGAAHAGLQVLLPPSQQ